MQAIKRTVIAMVILLTLFAAAYSNAGAVQKVKAEQISIITTDELYNAKKLSKNQVIIEKCIGIVDSKKGWGHVSGHPDWDMWYGDLRDDGKKLKPRTKVLSYFPCDDERDPIARYDFIQKKDKSGKKYWKLVNTED